jgi:hypothetical protein
MDNRIPPVIKDFAKDDTPEKIEGLNHLAFVDWINRKEHLTTDWIIVAKKDKIKENQDFYTISCFASPPDKETKELLFSSDSWEINNGFGIPYIEGSLKNEWSFQETVKYTDGKMTLKPFVFNRSFHNYIPNRFEISQPFLLYHEAFWMEEKKEYQFVEETGEIITLAKHTRNSEDDESILINTKYLRNYLALTKSYLIRFHDHRRRFDKKMPFNNKDYNKTTEDCSYRIEVYNENFMEGFLSYSRLLGKDIIKPFEKPADRFIFEEENFMTFIYDVDENGKPIEFSCEEKYLSSYFTDKGTPHFLTPVYFNKTVLVKYYSEPKRFSVTAHDLTCLSLWSMDIDITKEGLVQVWLGDLNKLPYNEQLHWKQYNVSPRGTISKYRFEADFEAKYLAPTIEESPISYLLESYTELNLVFEKRYGENLFLELTEHDQHYLKVVRVPLTDEWKEFDEQIQALAKIFCDSLNVKLLERIVEKKIDGKEVKGSISLLYFLMQKLNLSGYDTNLLIEPLQAIQTIRSTGAAHRKGERFDQSLIKIGIATLSNENKIKELVIRLHNGMVTLTKFYNSLTA